MMVESTHSLRHSAQSLSDIEIHYKAIFDTKNEALR